MHQNTQRTHQHSHKGRSVCGPLTNTFYWRHECPSVSRRGSLPRCKAIICHVNAGTWLNDQMQLYQVMDLIKVLYEPLTALPAVLDSLYCTLCCLLLTSDYFIYLVQKKK